MYPLFASAFEASYYWDIFQGRTSANGTIFSQSGHTAAICYEDLSQLAFVSTAQTGVVVTLTDRPNCTRYTDRIDLSSSVFSLFEPLSQGIIPDISAVPLWVKTGKFVKRNISQKEFKHLWIELKDVLGNIYFSGDTVNIQGRVTDNWKQAIVFLVGKKTWFEKVEAIWIDENWYFSHYFTFPNIPDEYYFVLWSGNSVNTRHATLLLLLDKNKINYPDIGTRDFQFVPKIISWTQPKMELPHGIWWSVQLSQGNKTYQTHWSSVVFHDVPLSIGRADIFVEWYKLSTPSSLDRSYHIPHIFSWSIMIDRIRDSTQYSPVNIKKVWNIAQFRFRINTWFLVNSNYFVTLPNGDVREYLINKKFIQSNWFLKPNTLITGYFPIPDKWTYRFEVNQSSWLAYINTPFYTEFTLPIIEPVFTLPKGEWYESYILNQMNKMRRPLGRSSLMLDSDLSKLAMLKAKDMFSSSSASSLWVSHTNSKWKNIQFFADFYDVRRDKLWENVAWSNNTSNTAILELHDGLGESPAHRNNIISPFFTRVWIGYYQNWWYSYLVHIFSN
jgi:uncharacterized protein YkwD